jgi:PAS domain S-box-containing protein
MIRADKQALSIASKLALMAAIVNIVALVGWWQQRDFSAAVFAHGLPTGPALLLMLLPLIAALFALERGLLIVATVCASLLLLLDMIIVGGWVLGTQPALGYPLFIVQGSEQFWFPTVSAAFALIALMLLGLGIVLLCISRLRTYAAPLAWTCGLLVVIGTPLVCAILAFDLGHSERFPIDDPVAYLIAGCVTLCGAALLLCKATRSVRMDNAARVRAAIIIAITGSTFALWYGMRVAETRQLAEETKGALESVAFTLDETFVHESTKSSGLVEHWANHQWQLTDKELLADSKQLLRDSPAMSGVTVADAKGEIFFSAHREIPLDATHTPGDVIVVTKTFAEKLARYGQDINALIQESLEQQEPLRGRSIQLDDRKILITVVYPAITEQGKTLGAVAFVYRRDLLLHNILGRVMPDLALRISVDGVPSYARDSSAPFIGGGLPISQSTRFNRFGAEFQLSAEPGGDIVKRNLTWQPASALAISWLALLLLSYALYSERRAQALLIDHERLLNESFDIIGTLDTESRFITLNAAARRKFGYSPEALRGRRLIELVYIDDIPVVEAHWRVISIDQKISIPTVRFVRKDGELLYIQCHVHWLPDQQHYHIDMRDVTEQHSLDAKRRHAENTFSAGVELAGCVVYEYYPIDSSIQWVGAIDNITGYTLDELSLGGLRAWIDCIHQDDRDRARQTLHRCLLTHQPYTMDYRLTRKDGKEIPVLDRGRPLIDADTQMPRIIGAILDLTTIRQQEAALRRSEERYRVIATQVGAIIIEQEIKTQRSQVHGPIEAILGYSREATEQQIIAVDELIHPDDRQRVVETKREAERKLSSYYSEFRYRHRDGHYVHIGVRGVYLPGPDGLAERSVVAMTDITERKQAEESLRESQIRFRAAAEQAHQVVYEWLLDKDGNTKEILIEGACEQVFGYTENQLIARLLNEPLAMVYHEDIAMFTENLQLRRGGANQYLVEHRAPHRDGSIFYVENRGAIFRDDSGKAVHILGMVLDINARKQAELDQQHQIVQLHALSDIARRVGTASSIQDLLKIVSDAMCELVKATAAVASIDNELQDNHHNNGHSDGHIAASSTRDCNASSRSKPLNSAPLHKLVLQSRKAVQLSPQQLHDSPDWQPLTIDDGLHYPLTGWLGVPLFARNGAIMGIIEVSNKVDGDFSESDLHILVQLAGLTAAAVENLRLYATLEQRVAARTRELEISNRELEAFSYSVSHDLRAPLRAIAGFSSILEQEYGAKLSDEGRRYVQRIVAGAQRMANLIDDLLSLARVSRADLTLEPVDLTSLARTVVKRQKERWPDRKVDIVVDARMRASADPRLVEVVFENLIENALKFTSTREETQIRIGRRSFDGKPAFFVSDNGVGFDPKYSTNLFGVFQRLHSESEFPGTGVGLATVQRIVQRHHGRAWAESVLNQGSTFYFTLEGN